MAPTGPGAGPWTAETRAAWRCLTGRRPYAITVTAKTVRSNRVGQTGSPRSRLSRVRALQGAALHGTALPMEGRTLEGRVPSSLAIAALGLTALPHRHMRDPPGPQESSAARPGAPPCRPRRAAGPLATITYKR